MIWLGLGVGQKSRGGGEEVWGEACRSSTGVAGSWYRCSIHRQTVSKLYRSGLRAH